MPQYDDSRFSPAAPVANITLRVPESGAVLTEVPMLIDTGADVTLLPQASVDLLGVEFNAGEAYQLEGFDGSISVSKVVRVDVIFGRKTFKGRFLLLDQEVGILGRDVLNNLRLILDGPRQVWDEQ